MYNVNQSSLALTAATDREWTITCIYMYKRSLYRSTFTFQTNEENKIRNRTVSSDPFPRQIMKLMFYVLYVKCVLLDLAFKKKQKQKQKPREISVNAFP